MLVTDQIKKGFLVCPETHEKLIIDKAKSQLITKKSRKVYKFQDGYLPILLSNKKEINKMLRNSGMSNEYEGVRRSQSRDQNFVIRSFHSFKHAFINFLLNDLRSEGSKSAMAIFDKYDHDSLCVAVGGGPKIHHKNLTNLNIAPFLNVDVVADAHKLPYVDGCVDSIYCEAVFEHLYDPRKAAKEMQRVLKRGGLAYCCTPFLQQYHGYPHHYQNLTLTGQQYLFESSGFTIIDSGPCVGPTMGLIVLNFSYIRRYIPILLPFAIPCAFIGLTVFKYLDLIINKNPNAHIMASTTYVVVRKN